MPGAAILDNEAVFRIILLGLWVSLFCIRSYYAARLHLAGDRVAVRKETAERESPRSAMLRLMVFLLLVAGLVIYAVKPMWMRWFILPLPSWLRWSGAILGLLSLPLLVWVQHSLDRQWSTEVQLREDHALVTSGPYRWVRHPMYAVIFIFLAALCLVSANWLFAAGSVVAIVVLYRRIDREEAMMIEQFGDEYRSYVERTGRFVPRFSRGGD